MSDETKLSRRGFVKGGSDGHFRARPMQLQRYDLDGVLWFATSMDSQK